MKIMGSGKLRTILVSLLIFTLSACANPDSNTKISGVGKPATPVEAGGGAQQRKITVYAAASLTDAFIEIGTEFEAVNPGIRVEFSFAGSQILRTQLEQGASADIFASADHQNMDLLIDEQLVSENTYQDFATNSLVVITPASNPAPVKALIDLAKPNLKLILADASVPAGDYARQVIKKMSEDQAFGKEFSAAVYENVVSNETDVRQVVTKVELGEADAGIVYASDASAAPELITIAIPEKYNITAHYPIAILKNAANAELARAFISYITSTDGQEILNKWGFKPGQ